MASIKSKSDQKSKYKPKVLLKNNCVQYCSILIFALLNIFCVSGQLSIEDLNYSDSKYVVNGPQCKIANLNPFDPKVMKMFKRQKQEFCVKEKPLTTVAKNETSGSYFIAIDETSSKDYGLENSSIVCCYQDISRPRDLENADKDIKLSKCVYFNQILEVSPSSDFIYVSCDKSTDLSKAVYKNVHVVVQEKKSVIDRFENFNSTTSKKPISVFIFLVDSMSRLSLIRAMPETNKYLKDNDWFELEGYNKVFANSFPNSMAFLTGFNESDAYSICKPLRFYGLDNCPMIWKTFEESGYATAYGEDESHMATFNFKKKGFVNPPTDYYQKPAMDAAHKLLEAKKKSGSSLCHGFKFAAEYISEYGVDFAELYKGKPYFGFFWVNSFSHNNLSDPSGMDSWMASKLKDIEQKGILEDSIVIFLADHGFRIKITSSLLHYEDRLPMMHMSLPKWLKNEHPEIVRNLRINKNRLTTHYDLHMTLKHILQLSGRASSNITGARGCPKCQSLFEEIPLDRSCEDAGIPEEWCTCNKYEPKF